jgi:hypothetical protein
MPITPIRPKWPGAMTDRERFVRQMHYAPVDRCFNMEFGYWNENFTEWPLFYEHGITSNAEADIFFNFDRIHSVGGHIWLSPAFESIVVDETETTKIMINADGLLAEVPKDATTPSRTSSSPASPHRPIGRRSRKSASAATILRARSTSNCSKSCTLPAATTRWASTAVR